MDEPMDGAGSGPLPLSAERDARGWRSADGTGDDPVIVRSVQFSPLEAARTADQPVASLDMLLDVSVRVSVELGRTSLSIREVLQLARGSVVELDKLAGDPVDIYVNDTLIAQGEVVVVGEKFGVRVTEVVARARPLGVAARA